MWAHGPKGRTPVDLEWSQAAYGWALSAGAAAKAVGKAIFDGIWEGLGDLWQLGADIIDWVLQGLKAMKDGLIQEAKNIGSAIKDGLNPVNAIKDAGSGLKSLVGGQEMADGREVSTPQQVTPTGAYGQSLVWNGSSWEQPGTNSGAIVDAAFRNGTYGSGQVGAAPLVINVGTMNVRDASDARQAAGDLRYALASAGLGCACLAR